MTSGGTLRVMVLVDSLAPGGTEISTTATLPMMADYGIVVDLVICKSMLPGRGEQDLDRLGLTPRNLLVGDSPLSVARAIRPLLRESRPDLLHASLFAPIVGGAIGAARTGVPVLASLVNTPPEMGGDGHRNDAGGARWKVHAAALAEGFVLRRMVAGIHAVTPGVRTAAADRYGLDPSRVLVAERGRDATRFAPAPAATRAQIRKELGIPEDAQVVATLGRQEPQKGFLDLVDAVALTAARLPELKVVLAGRDGADTPALRARIRERGLGEHVMLIGDRSDPERILAAADAYVLPSLREGASGATIEAMAMGLPVVATDVKGLDGILHNGKNARIVARSQPAAMADALVEVLEDRHLAQRLGDSGRATFTERFTLERAARSMAELYRSVASAAR